MIKHFETAEDMTLILNYDVEDRPKFESIKLPSLSEEKIKSFRDVILKQNPCISGIEFRSEFSFKRDEPVASVYKIYIDAVVAHEDFFEIVHSTPEGFFKDKGIFIHYKNDSLGYNLCEAMFKKEPLIIEYY